MIVSFFLCMFVFASFTKEDRQKVWEFKRELILKLNLKNSTDLEASSLANIEARAYEANSDRHQKNSIKTSFKKTEAFPLGTSSEVLSPARTIIGIYTSKEKQGTIGTFSEKEQDQLTDNFFTIEIPSDIKKNCKVYLEYELFGLASHQSVPRSINQNIAIGGEIVIPSGQWAHQKEEINGHLLRAGINTVLFTSPANGVKYKVKDLKIVCENSRQPISELVINTLLSEDKLYIKGSFAGNNLLINSEHIILKNNEFEKIIKLSDKEKRKEFFTVSADGITTNYKIPNNKQSFNTLLTPYTETKSIQILNDQEYHISFQEASISIEKESTLNFSQIDFSSLREKDIPTTTQGIKNITPASGAYRLQVKGKLTKNVKLTIPFDPKRLGLTPAKDIKTFYFDYAEKQWKLEKSAVVDEENKTVTIESKGDGDYINGIISVPESPQINAFAPTTISGLKTADPMSAVQLISAPSPNQRGDAALSYPVVIPSGVQGMQPNISISYSSSKGNGWMGEGWDISGVSGITLDTRWGTPTFDPGFESEIYLLDGEMLVYEGDYLPHRHTTSNGVYNIGRQPRNNSGKKTFYLRKNNGFTRIERYGNTPKTYTWIVTTTDGTKKYYGGDGATVNDNAVVKTDNNEIVQWGITKELDVHNNNIKYYYDNKVLHAGTAPVTGDNVNLDNGRQFHIEKITYSGKNDADGPYWVSFYSQKYDRPDYSINAKEGLKRVETMLLEGIQVAYTDPNGTNSGTIRQYTFGYTTGAFYKSLLQKISGPGVNYQLDYHNDAGNTIFGADKFVSAPSPDAFSGVVNSLLTPSKISADNNLEWGWSVRAGVGLGLLKPHRTGDKNFMVSGFKGESYPDIKKAIELIDFNGDGISDILYRKRNGDNGLRIIPGSLDNNGNLQFVSGEKDILNLKSNFTRTTGTTSNNGVTALFNWWKMGFDLTKSWSKSKTSTPVYLIDANSDGLPDIVKDNKVWFNKIKDNGQPEMVTTSDLTENMVLKDNIVLPYTEPEDDEGDNEEPVKAKNDVVKVWIAPKSGFIKISDIISMADPVSEAQAIYSIEMKDPLNMPKNGRLFLRKLSGGNAPFSLTIERYNTYPAIPLGIANADRIAVKSGDKIYFRLHKKTGTNYVVNTSPIVKYVNSNGVEIADSPDEEQDGFQPNALKYEQKFFLNNLVKTLNFSVTAPSNTINIPGFTVPKLNDKVRYSITLSKTDVVDPVTDIQILYEKTYLQSSAPANINPVNLSFAPQSITPGGWHLKFSVESDSYMNKDLEWKNIEVKNGQNMATVHDIADYPSYFIADMKKKFHIADLGNAPQGSNDYFISVNKSFTFSPALPGNFIYIIKKNGLVIDKRRVQINASGLSETTMSGTAIAGIDPILFYSGNPYQSVQLNDKINILVFCITPNDRAAYNALRTQLQGKLFNIYYGPNKFLLSGTTETSVNTGEFNGISAVYHNWGQFIYDESKDVIKGKNPLTPPDPRDPQTGPISGNGPDYVPNPNTPKDQYGALINSEFLDNPFGAFNTDFSSCAGNTNANDYAECIGDIAQADFQNIGNTNILAGMNPIVSMITYNMKKGNAFLQKWINGFFTEQYSMPSSFRDEESIDPFFVTDDPDEGDVEVQGNTASEMYAIEKKQKSMAKTTNWGLGIPVISTSTSQLRGYGNLNTQDFFDVNGDGYPDMIYRDQSQLTNALGGLKGAQGRNLENSSDSPISTADSFQRTNTIAFSNAAVKTVGRMVGNKGSDAKGDESTAWSGGLGYSTYPNSYDKGLKFWADINGDGLVDRVDNNGTEYQYKLNYGTGLIDSPYEIYSGLDTYNSKPVGAASISIGPGLSGLISATSTFSQGFGISGNITASSSTGTSKKTFQDVNGDGLADLITVDDNGGADVSYNMGNKFASPTSLSKIGGALNYGNESRNYNGGLTINVGYYANLPLVTFFGITLLYLRFGSDLSGSLGTTVSEINKGMRDVNGDGYPDLVVNNGNGLQVNYSRIGRTNKLAKVSEADSQGAFTINYEFSKPTYNDAHSKLVMSEVKILNPDINSPTYTQSATDKDMVTKFRYENSKFDRRERTSYGFETVTAESMNGTSVYRKAVQTYHNSTYFNNGLERRTDIYANGVLSATTDNTYKLYNYTNNHTEIAELPSAQFETYDVGGTEGNRMAMILPSGTTSTNYEGGISLTTSRSITYNTKGQVTKYQYNSNVASGSYSSTILYHSYPTLLAANILDIPSEIKVFSNNNTLLRQRSTQVDQNTGDVTQINVMLTLGTSALTNMTYDTFGNVKTITYPTGYTLTYEYDLTGKYVLKVTDNFNVFSSAIYDPKWDAVLESTDPSGNKIKYTYDAFGRTSSVLAPKEAGVSPYTVQYSYFTSPLGTGNTAPKLYGSITQNFDPLHPANPIETISLADFTGKTVQVKKDIDIAGTEKMSVSGITWYDIFGRPVRQYHPTDEAKDAVLNKKLKLSTAVFYTSAQYDAQDRVIYSFDEDGNQTENKYAIDNAMFKVTSEKMQNTSVLMRTEKLSDAEGRTVKTISHIGSQPLITTFSYNSVGDLVYATDPDGMTTGYQYDMAGRRITENHPDREISNFEYDAAGNLVKKYTANLVNSGLSQTYIWYKYNYNRLTNIYYPNLPNGTANPSNVTYQYGTTGTGKGRITRKIDGTGNSDYQYGNMGELIYEKRVVMGYNIPTMNFTTRFGYDSWNRIRYIMYSDGEQVQYLYDLGGNLKTIRNDKNVFYIKNIEYDTYGQRTKVLNGNDTYSLFTYLPKQRILDTHVLKKDGYTTFLANSYKYDLANNITKITNDSPLTPNQLGGSYEFIYSYDALNRLTHSEGAVLKNLKDQHTDPNNVTSSYSTSLTYTPSSGINTKSQSVSSLGVVNPVNTYNNKYNYFSGTHKVSTVLDQATSVTNMFKYDNNGNVTTDALTDDHKFMFWDEEDNLKAYHADEAGVYQYNVYDDKGERTIKYNLNQSAKLYQNGALVDGSMSLRSYSVYPNPYMTVTSDGKYTKHYYAGTQRIASYLMSNTGQISKSADSTAVSGSSGVADADFEAGFRTYAEKAGLDMEAIDAQLKAPVSQNGIYYLHGDQLGTATFVTDGNGLATQFFLNLPFGETFVEQQVIGKYKNPYKFNAKELDSETALYYYGARYYNPRLSIWYGVDPLAEKMPRWSPYTYAFDNPVRYTDPTGMEPKDDHFNKHGRFMYRDNKKTNNIIVHTDQGEAKLSQLNYSKRGTLKAVSNILAHYSSQKNIGGYTGVATGYGFSAFTHPDSKNIFFNISELKSGIFNNLYNIKSTLNHEGGRFGHKNEKFTGAYTFEMHSKVYLNEAINPDFSKTTEAYRAGQAVSFAQHVLNAAQKESSYGNNHMDMIDTYNQKNSGDVYINTFSGGNGLPTSTTITPEVGNKLYKTTSYENIKHPED
ncbi:hypothetical protein MKJ01_15990 [Chryseobacterium sp. SSA4.19]|uniref:RHS repeat-associated core domain-containing protein n=1 Tax=Chryseobacterium sp. SSA4.19 TaxID=2919915 RepID=UPI001F4DE20A|nr:SpvB/TcaC N-terminal domain-containing protein [Chryseobacterium sp. SSA4.19]MCJ8155266.1 hypothetical protein [Chryseobacterium sp. SSA4.19]